MNNQDLNTFLLLMLAMGMLVFMGIWAYIGWLILRGVRKVTKTYKRTVGTLTGFSQLPVYSAAPLVRPAKAAVPMPMPSVPILRRVSTIIYTKEY